MQALRSSVFESYRPWRYSDDVRQLCIKMYLNGMGLRGIERVTNIHHTTVMHWIHAGHELTDAPASDEIPETDLDELQTFVGKSDKNLARHHWRSFSILVVGDRSAETFKRLWWIVSAGRFWYGARWLYGLSSVH